MIAVIDNYDSFVYNLVQYLLEIVGDVRVFRNDKITVSALDGLRPDAIVLSPGPCTPLEAGICIETVKKLGGKYPILGVCLGHQSIAHACSGTVVRAEKLVHGKTSEIFHDGRTIFKDIPRPFTATRYHSLIVERKSLPDCFTVSAETEDGAIMGIRHREFPIEGLQFHPESILTQHGLRILKNFYETYCAPPDKACPGMPFGREGSSVAGRGFSHDSHCLRQPDAGMTNKLKETHHHNHTETGSNPDRH